MIEPFLMETEVTLEKVEENLNIEMAAALIEKLKPLLKSGNPESTEYINEVKATLSPLGKDCEILVHQIEDYDFDAAYEIICSINIA